MHKFQGQKITKPTRLVGHMERINQAAQAYVLLGRIQSIDQLYLSSLDSSKIKINQEALAEAFRLPSVTLNPKRPLWYETSHFKICHLNIRSLSKHFDDLRYDPTMLQSNIICLSETWMIDNNVNDFKRTGYVYNALFNSCGRGKGMAIYYSIQDVKYLHICSYPCQMSKLSISNYDIFVFYRPQNCPQTELLALIQEHRSINTTTVICGDFNLNLLGKDTNCIYDFLLSNGVYTSHHDANALLGGLLDHIYVNTKVMDL